MFLSIGNCIWILFDLGRVICIWWYRVFWNRFVFFSCHNFIYTRCEIICCLRMCMSKSVSVSFSKGDIITHGDLDNLRVIRIILQKDQKQPCRVSTYSRFKCIITFVFKPEVAPHKKHYQIKLNLNKFNTSRKESIVMNITILE